MTTERKLFTAEIKRLQQRGEATPNASNAEVLKAINDLRNDLRHLVAGGETSWHGYASFVLDYARRAGINLKVASDAVHAVPTSAFPTNC